MNLNPLFENEAFIAIDKPTGWLSVPSRLGKTDLRPCVGMHLQEQLGRQLWPLHRLDFEVSGIIIFAKTALAQKQASSLFEHRDVKKTYQAFTEDFGKCNAAIGETFVWQSKLLRGKKRAYESERGKASLTKATPLAQDTKRGFGCITWDLRPVTGRPHQLRFELAKHGFPIIGDSLYGSQRPFAPDAIALKCVLIAFPNVKDRKLLPETIKAEQLFW